MPRAPQIAVEDRRAPRRPSTGRRPPTPPRQRIGLTPPPRTELPRRTRFRLLRYATITLVWCLLLLGGVLLWFARDLPHPEAALDAVRRPSLSLEDRNGHIFAAFGDVVGDPLRLSDMPAYLPAAVVAIEDRRFWSHGGVDFIGLARAAFTDLTSGQIRQGGSTITQQVAKNLFLTNARTFRRKVQELLLTLWLERTFTKREILEIYLNRVYLGSGTWGVDAAARMYFGVSARHVTLWQAAVLAGLPRAPSRLNPRADPEAAAARAREVLAALAATGAITPGEQQEASAQIAFPPTSTFAAGWFADWLADQAEALAPQNADATVRTTLDPHIQSVAEQRLTSLLDGAGAGEDITQGAVVVIDAATGAVRAMVGGRDYRQSPYNRAVLMRRQPGSAFKPFTWLAALEKGVRPDDTVLDAPIRIGNWSPGDFERKFLGEITVEEALAQSINTSAVRLLYLAGGPRAVTNLAAQLGITDKLPDNASIALGTGEVGLLELASAYATFFNGGMRVAPYGVESLRSDGKAIEAAHAMPKSVIDPDLAAMMARMMTAVVTRGTGRAAAVTGHVVAGKTGTTQDYRDAWFIGDIDGQIIGIWLGNDNNKPMKSVQGGTLPARLFHDIASAITR
jgi:penicillin-binding protein 1A